MRVEPGHSRSTDSRQRRTLPAPAPTDRLRLGSARALFLRLAGATPGPTGLAASASAAAIASTAPEWADVRALARREEVTAAVWPRLRRALDAGGGAGGALPEEVEEAFRREAMVAEFAARRLEAQLQEVLAILAARGIEPVLLKGAGLAYSVFGGIAKRPMRDLDLLVPRESLVPALAALGSSGWAPSPGQRPAGSYDAHHHAPPLVAPSGGTSVVELHDSLFPAGHPFHLHGSAVISRARRIPSPIGALLVPAEADQLLHACLHFAWSHELRWGAWRAVADIAALLAAAAAEDAAAVGEGSMPTTRALDELAGSARAVAGESAVYWTLRLAATLGEVPVPEAWLTELEAGGWGESALVERHLVHQLLPGPGNVPSTFLARALWSAALRPGPSGHGSARPWLVGSASHDESGVVRKGHPLSGLGRHLSASGRWRSYLSTVLG